MDSAKDAAVAVTVVAAAADDEAATTAEQPAASDDDGGTGGRLALILDRLRGAARPIATSALVAFHFAWSAYEYDGAMIRVPPPPPPPRRLPPLAALALAYAAVAALMWFDWWMERPRPLDAREERVKLAARVLASALVGGLVYWTLSPAPCGLLIFIWYFGSEY